VPNACQPKQESCNNPVNDNKQAAANRKLPVVGVIVGATFLFVFIGFLTMPSMASGTDRDAIFHHRAFQFGLVGSSIAAVCVFVKQRCRLRVLFFLELFVALSIVFAYFHAYKRDRDIMIELYENHKARAKEYLDQTNN